MESVIITMFLGMLAGGGITRAIVLGRELKAERKKARSELVRRLDMRSGIGQIIWDLDDMLKIEGPGPTGKEVERIVLKMLDEVLDKDDKEGAA